MNQATGGTEMTQATPATTRPVTIPRPPRDTRVDIIRGLLQLTIFASHAGGSFAGTWLIHKAWGLSDSSEQFIFLSGFMLGSVMARKTLMQGWRAGARDMWWRALNLYRTHLLVFALFGVMIALASKSGLLPGELHRLGWGFMLDHPWQAIPEALATLYLPEFVNILPVFVWCMAALPLFGWLEARAGAWSLSVPLGLYAAVWTFGLTPPALGSDHPLGFNPFAWQVLFMLGAWLGRRSLLLGEALPASRWLTAGAVAVVVFSLWLRLGWYGWLPGGAPLPDLEIIWNKNHLAPLRLLHALSLAWLVACLVPRDRAWMHGTLGRWCATGGKYSLQIFCLGLFLSWIATAVFRLWPAAMVWTDPLMIVAGCFLLLLFAQWLDRRRGAPQGVAITAPVEPSPSR
ncbi:MAG: OpgC family protein [Acetobacteraceae bacterium]